MRKFLILPYFDAAFVPGARQRLFAKKLGIKGHLIQEGALSCNVEMFSQVNPTWDRNFVYVGRVSSEKGILGLVHAYEVYRKSVVDPFRLHIIGSGPLVSLVNGQIGIDFLGFIQPHELPESMKVGSCFILNSKKEPWGLVLHEAAALGLPVISTDACGSSDLFLENNKNGFLIGTKKGDLVKAMIKIHNLSLSELEGFSVHSKNLARKVTCDTWAENFIALMYKCRGN